MIPQFCDPYGPSQPNRATTPWPCPHSPRAALGRAASPSPPRAIDAARGSPTRCPAPTPPSPSLHSSLHPHPGSAEPDSHRSRGGEPSDGGAAGSGPRPGSGVGLTAAPAGSASASLVSRNRSSEGSARPGTNRGRHNARLPHGPTAPQPHRHLPHSRALSVTRRSPHRSLLVICPHPGAAPHPHIPAAKAEPYTRWLLSAHRGSGPLLGSETIPTPPPPRFVIKSNPSGLHRDACYSRSLSSRAGISCLPWGDSPSPSYPAGPLLLLLFCVSPLLRGAEGSAGSFVHLGVPTRPQRPRAPNGFR